MEADLWNIVWIANTSQQRSEVVIKRCSMDIAKKLRKIYTRLILSANILK